MCDLYTALTANNNALLTEIAEAVGASDAGAIVNEIKTVCEDINTLTFNRITDFFTLTEFQQKTLVRMCGRFLQFKRDNAELLGSVIRSYSVNGVSMSFDDATVKQINGVYVPGDVYALLRQTGLTCRCIR